MASFPGNSPMSIYQGDEYTETFIITTSVNGVSGPVSLVGMNIDMQIRPVAGSATLYASTSTGTIVIQNRVDASGQFDVFLSSTITGAFTWTSGAYDIQISSGTGSTGSGQFEATTPLYGTVTVTPRVTKITY